MPSRETWVGTEVETVHLLGICGSGMLPLALLLHEGGFQVGGSDDKADGGRVEMLRERGIAVSAEASPERVARADRIIVSPAVAKGHPERRAAERLGKPAVSRARALAALLSARETICVAGSHGKSTTAAMLVHILAARGYDFGYMVGAETVSGDLPPARLGAADTPFVMEACEAYGALDDWQPRHILLTNVDNDHADHYPGETGLYDAFADFVARVPAGGVVAVCGDDAVARAVAGDAMTFGFGPENRLCGRVTAPGHMTVILDGESLGEVALAIPGRHNLLNALGALAMALRMGVDFPVAAGALGTFGGIARRLQRIGGGPVGVFDDFAHHPAEIAAALAAVRETRGGRIIAVLEPQLHSRVGRMAAAFADALRGAARSILLPVAGLGEASAHGDAALHAACRDAGLDFEVAGNRRAVLTALQRDLRDGDTVVVMAGRTGEGLARFLSEQARLPDRVAPVLKGEVTPPAPGLLPVFFTQARVRPEAPAVEMGHRQLTYGRLAARVRDLSSALSKAGVTPGHCVAVCLGRSVDRVAAFLACLDLGAVYLPLDPGLPRERRDFILADAEARIAVVNAASPPLADLDLGFVNCGLIADRACTEADLAAGRPSIDDSVAYLIYTSGTSGHPKGVEVGTAAIANYAAAASAAFDIGPESRVSQVSGFGFDVSVGDMAMAVFAGACLVWPTDMQGQPGAPMGRFIAQARITHLSLTPSALGVIPEGQFPHLSHIVVAGEACPPALVARWGTGRTFINAYGPTEATVEASWAICRPGVAVTIGTPIANMGACILDKDLQPAAEGELCLFGVGLAKGYRNQPELTAARFPVVDLPDLGATRVYRTGDRALAGADGALRYLGRLDDQFKFHGYRIEPGEIEAALCRCPGILDAVVSVHGGQGGDRLIAHVVPAAPLDVGGLRRHLSESLPAFMVPSLFLPVPGIPLTANGKRDRSALPVPPDLFAPAAPKVTGTPTEAAIVALVCERLGARFQGGIRDSLTQAGLDSLAMADLLFALEDRFGIVLDGAVAQGADTIEMLALMVDARQAGLPLGPGGARGGLATALRPHLAAWPGRPAGVSGLLRRIGHDGGLPALFWCFQSGQEFAALDAAIRNAANLYGMRSGHLAFEYGADNLAALAAIYADDVEAVAPRRPICLGGNCQGGLVMRHVGLELLRRGRDVALTVLMEQGRFPHYPGRVALLFGARSYLNPYGQMEDPDQVFRLAYPGGHDVAILPGGHGQYFNAENVGALASVIATHMAAAVGR